MRKLLGTLEIYDDGTIESTGNISWNNNYSYDMNRTVINVDLSKIPFYKREKTIKQIMNKLYEKQNNE